MSFHRNAKLGLGGRCALVGAIEGGLSIRAAAVRFNVSPATAHRWCAAGGRRTRNRAARTPACPTARADHRLPRAGTRLLPGTRHQRQAEPPSMGGSRFEPVRARHSDHRCRTTRKVLRRSRSITFAAVIPSRIDHDSRGKVSSVQDDNVGRLDLISLAGEVQQVSLDPAFEPGLPQQLCGVRLVGGRELDVLGARRLASRRATRSVKISSQPIAEQQFMRGRATDAGGNSRARGAVGR
jgi:hypothetical protein